MNSRRPFATILNMPQFPVKRDQLKPGEVLCSYCTALCCRYFSVPIDTPTLAPFPTPTPIDIGVASPKAHGQAMMTTDTAEISAYENAGASRTATRELALWLREHVEGLDVTMVVDGAEQFATPELRRAISAMVDATHDVARWIFTTRDPGVLPLSAWMTRRWSGPPIDARVLAFTVEEARTLACLRGCDRGDDEIVIRTIESRTGLAGRAHGDPD